MNPSLIFALLAISSGPLTLVQAMPTSTVLGVTPIAEPKSSPLSQILTQQNALLLANKIWQNEGGGKDQYLTHWNKNEDFASLGMGHFIWYPAETLDRPYKESFPALLAFIQSRGIDLPMGLTPNSSCPWPTRESFYEAINSPETDELREFLKNTFAEQALFIAQRLNKALPTMLAAAPEQNHAHIKSRFNALMNTPNGVYALMDYTNFKGEGTHPKERYQNQGWGLLQALEEMPEQSTSPLKDFVTATDFILTRRVHLAPKEESQWLPGWRKRLQSYL